MNEYRIMGGVVASILCTEVGRWRFLVQYDNERQPHFTYLLVDPSFGVNLGDRVMVEGAQYRSHDDKTIEVRVRHFDLNENDQDDQG